MSKKKILIMILVLIIVLVFTFGVSYAFFVYRQSGQNNQILAGNINLNYETSNSIGLVEAYPMSKSDAAKLDNNIINFSINGQNSSDDTNLYYQILINRGSDIDGKKRLNDYDLTFSLTSTIDGVTKEIVSEGRFSSLNDGILWVGCIPYNTINTVTHNFTLRMWLNGDVIVSDTDANANYTTSAFKNSYANIRVDVKGNTAPVVYSIKRDLNSTSSSWIRTDNNVGKVANAQVGTISVQNDFDSIYPWSEIKSFNYNVETNEVTAWYGDSNFKFDGSNGEVMTHIPEFYYKREQKVIEGITTEYISITPYEEAGFIKSEAFAVARYLGSYDGTKAHSISNSLPKNQISVLMAKTYSESIGSNFSLMDYHYFILQLLYLVEYGDYNIQNTLGPGNLDYNFLFTKIVTEAVDDSGSIIPNTVIILKTTTHYIGQSIAIGINSDTDNSIAPFRTITNIVNTTMVINGTSKDVSIITFDGENLLVPYASNVGIHCTPQVSGTTDFLGMKSGTTKKEVRNAIIYRGIDNISGNLSIGLDGINVRLNSNTIDGITTYERKVYINYNYKTYNFNNITGDYQLLGYTLPSGTYYSAVEFGYDSNNSLVSFTSKGTNYGSQTQYSLVKESYTSSNYNNNTGILIGGNGLISSNGNNYGIWYIDTTTTTSRTSSNIGFRFILHYD